MYFYAMYRNWLSVHFISGVNSVCLTFIYLQVQAHKVILAASSGYFRSILKRNPGPNPILIMPPDVKHNDLASILEFIYHGEVR